MPLKAPINLPRQSKPQSGVTRNAQFVVVRSTGLFVTDPVLRKQRAKANYIKPTTLRLAAPGRAGRF